MRNRSGLLFTLLAVAAMASFVTACNTSLREGKSISTAETAIEDNDDKNKGF